jgi:hypothetical protein
MEGRTPAGHREPGAEPRAAVRAAAVPAHAHAKACAMADWELALGWRRRGRAGKRGIGLAPEERSGSERPTDHHERIVKKFQF